MKEWQAHGQTWEVEELTRVTAEDLAETVNRRVGAGWQIERIDYIKDAGVRRPQMAFLFFSRPSPDAAADVEPDEVRTL
jgi:hypothetical protein